MTVVYLMGGPTFPQSSRFASATVAWREPTSSARRRFISFREPLFLSPFLSESGKQLSAEKPILLSGPTFPQAFGSDQNRRGESDAQRSISGPDPLFLSPLFREWAEVH